MKLSVVIPNYNNSNYLRETIESALKILPARLGEIIFVDDCSTDDSFYIAQEYKKVIKIYQNEKNLGQEVTTNKGLELASGEYCVILHSDDILHPNFYTDLSKLVECYPAAVMAVGERVEINAEGDVFYSPPPFYDGDYWIPGLEQAKVFLLSGFLPCQVMFKREVVLSFGGAKIFFNVNLDGLLWFKAALNGDVLYTQKPVCSYRRHNASTTSGLNKSITHLFEYYCTLKEMFNYAQSLGVDFENKRHGAFNRISELALRYAKEIYITNDISLCKRYLMLAEVINPNIRETSMFRDLENTINNGGGGMPDVFIRKVSYCAPPGSEKI